LKIWTPDYKKLSSAQLKYVFDGARIMVNLKVIKSCEECPRYEEKKK